MGLKNLPQVVLIKKTMVQRIDERDQEGVIKVKFLLVPFFSVLEKIFKIDLQLLSFVQVFTYILYCPNIAKYPWLL
jgi:hypothetical protein